MVTFVSRMAPCGNDEQLQDSWRVLGAELDAGLDISFKYSNPL